ncbi:MAG: DUF3460 family protein [Sulfuritalea sp.]|nr:DUF3460 family protein [Sulfuritalea sp.]
MALYESEHTKFMREWLEKHPEEFQERQKGRALWWDKAPRPLEAMKEDEAAKVPNKAYYYDAN